jgi:hypothetical protein
LYFVPQITLFQSLGSKLLIHRRPLTNRVEYECRARQPRGLVMSNFTAAGRM